MTGSGILGLIVNPHSGRDARRLFARAGTSTIEDKRNQVTRIVVGAAAAGIGRVVLARDAFRIASSAVEALSLPVDCELLDLPTTGHASDSENAARAMRAIGCEAIVALGGDGTSRAITRAWRDVVLLPLSTGTNNVFPFELEATVAGAAAGLVASGRLPHRRGRAPREDHTSALRRRSRESRPDRCRAARRRPSRQPAPGGSREARSDPPHPAEPASVGLSPVGGLLLPCGAEEDFGVEVRTHPGPHPEQSGKTLRAPLSPGLYATVGIESVARVELDAPLEWRGPGLLAFDGDREIELAAGERATLEVTREGPFVIEPPRALAAAARLGLFIDMGHWHDPRSGGHSCC